MAAVSLSNASDRDGSFHSAEDASCIHRGAARLGSARWHSKGPPDDGQVGERGRGLTIVLTPAIITGKTRSNISGNSAVILRHGELPVASPAEFFGGEAAFNGTRIRGMHSEKFKHAERRYAGRVGSVRSWTV